VKCPEPSIAFAMDFTEKVIAGGKRAYILNILDNFKQEYNFRSNMAFGYMSPYEKKYKYLFNKISPENNLLSWLGAI
jgi:hypothetical protein